MRRVGLLLDTSALIGYAAGRAGVVELLGSLEGEPFGVPLRVLLRAVNVEPMVPHLLIDVERIIDFAGFTLLPTPVEVDKNVREAYETLFPAREDVVAALIASHTTGCPIATYEPDSYTMAGYTFDDVLPLVDGWLDE